MCAYVCLFVCPPQTEVNNEVVTHYLVKWCSLPYEDATWELEEDVDAESIRKFNLLQILPPEDQLEVEGLLTMKLLNFIDYRYSSHRGLLRMPSSR